MQHLDQFVLQTGKQPVDWTSGDIDAYLAYVKKQVMTGAPAKSAAGPATWEELPGQGAQRT